MSVRKKFDTALFNENDMLARQAVSDYVSSGGFLVRPNPDQYGPDLVVYKGFKPSFYVEVEVKRVWKDTQDEFPWETIQIPERKKKFLKLGMPIEFFILRSDRKLAVVIPDFVLENSPLVEVPNKMVASGEMFYQVDVTQCNLVDLTVEPELE